MNGRLARVAGCDDIDEGIPGTWELDNVCLDHGR